MSWKAKALEQAKTDLSKWVDETIALASIPAPSHEEYERARHVTERLRHLGYTNVQKDDVDNVWVDVEGTGDGPHIMFVAHLDTVFDRDVHTPAVLDGDVLRGPSVADNSVSVVSLLALAEMFQTYTPEFPGKVTFAMSVGEEGVGNLKGVRALMDRPDRPDIVIAIDGSVGRIMTRGIASVRFEVTVQTEGGHSWGAFGNENAIAVAAACITDLEALPLSVDPKTTLNVGIFQGGIAVNAIAGDATFHLDLRSVEQHVLDGLREQVEATFDEYAKKIQGEFTYKRIGERPGGSLAEGHYLLDVVKKAHEQLGLQSRIAASSTDANIPLSLGIPAVTLGVCRGANTHRTDEYLHVDSIPLGIQQLILVLDGLWREAREADSSLVV